MATNALFPISLSTTCTGHACDTAQYQWTLIRVDSLGYEMEEISLTRAKMKTDFNLPVMVFKEKQLHGTFYYQFKVTVTQNNGPDGMAGYEFTMNGRPYEGTCSVQPQSGEALSTNFKFDCGTGWQVSKDQDRLGTGNIAFGTSSIK